MSECFSTSDGDWRCHTLSRIDVSSAPDRPRPIRLFSCIVSTSCMSPKPDCNCCSAHTTHTTSSHRISRHLLHPQRRHPNIAVLARLAARDRPWTSATGDCCAQTSPPSSLLTRTRPHTGYAFLDPAHRRSCERARHTATPLLAGAVGLTDAKREESAKPAVGSLLPQTDGDVFNADIIIPCTNRHIFSESY